VKQKDGPFLSPSIKVHISFLGKYYF